MVSEWYQKSEWYYHFDVRSYHTWTRWALVVNVLRFAFAKFIEPFPQKMFKNVSSVTSMMLMCLVSLPPSLCTTAATILHEVDVDGRRCRKSTNSLKSNFIIDWSWITHDTNFKLFTPSCSHIRSSKKSSIGLPFVKNLKSQTKGEKSMKFYWAIKRFYNIDQHYKSNLKL